MNLNSIEAGQPEEKLNNEQTADNSQVSPSIANAPVVGSLFGRREIKFRVWDEDNSIMLHDDGREQVDISFYGGKPAVIHHFQEHTIEREGIEMDVPVSNLLTDFILMQYTGLKDKNGKEVYEGDIFKYQLPDWDYITKEESCTEYTEVVIFKDASFTLEGISIGVTFEYGEVIGNIFENSELLQTLR